MVERCKIDPIDQGRPTFLSEGPYLLFKNFRGPKFSTMAALTDYKNNLKKYGLFPIPHRCDTWHFLFSDTSHFLLRLLLTFTKNIVLFISLELFDHRR